MGRYYPNGSNKKRTDRENEFQGKVNNDLVDFLQNRTMMGNGFQNLGSLYHVLSEGNLRNERDYWVYSVMNSIPGLSGYLQGKGQYSDLISYMDKTGLTWSDLKPWRVANQGARSMMSSVNYVGDMVRELYS